MPRQKTFKVHLPGRPVPEWNLDDFREFVARPKSRVLVAQPPSSQATPPLSGPMRELDVPTEILLPEYAIGVGLITREEYEGIRSDYFTQTQWTLGLIIPLLLLWAALAMRDESARWWVHAIFITLVGVAFVGGMDRLHNYYAQLQSLIAGKYVAKVMAREAAEAAAAAPKPPPAGASPTLKDIRADLAALKDLIEKDIQKPPITVINNIPAPHDEAESSTEPLRAEADDQADRLAERARKIAEQIEELRRRRREAGPDLDLRPQRAPEEGGNEGGTGS
jgi:hypothetical protein